MSPPKIALAVAVPALLALCPSAQDWPHWRGPTYDGSTTAEGLPTDFDRGRGIRWAAPMPGPSAATPVILGERVFVSSIDAQAGTLLAICLARGTGEVLWSREAGSDYRPAGGKGTVTGLHARSNYASPSPATDGERVVFFFGNGDLVAFDLDGERLWARNLQQDHGDFAFQWTFSSSPTLWEGLLFLAVLQRDQPANGLGREGGESFLLALDPATGKTVFRRRRPSQARMESLESYATPIPHRGAGGRKEILLVGGDAITGHDPATGEELWRWGDWNPGHREPWWRIVPSPVVAGDVALVCAPKRAPTYAIRLGGSGSLGDDALVWRSEGRRNPISSDVPTPLYFEDRLFVLSDVRGSLSRVDPKTGSVDWTVEMPGKNRWRASPTGADGRIWCMDHGGGVAVVDAEDGSIVAQAAMGEEDADLIRSTIAVAHGALFIRTNTTLFCVGKTADGDQERR